MLTAILTGLLRNRCYLKTLIEKAFTAWQLLLVVTLIENGLRDSRNHTFVIGKCIAACFRFAASSMSSSTCFFHVVGSQELAISYQMHIFMTVWPGSMWLDPLQANNLSSSLSPGRRGFAGLILPSEPCRYSTFKVNLDGISRIASSAMISRKLMGKWSVL